MTDAALITGAFAEFLDANRGSLNLEVAATARQASGFDPAAFADVLRTTVVPAVDAVDRLGDGFVGVVSQLLFSIALDLSGQRRFEGAVRDGWDRLLPPLAPQIATDPQRVIASVTNALDTLARTPGARVGQWIDLVLAAAPHAPTADLVLAAGQVAAWRSGMAVYRGDALALAARLDPAVATGALGLPDGVDVAATIDRLAADPWFDPGVAPDDEPGGPSTIARVGAFRGFGGSFLRPPTIVAASPMRALVTDGADRWFVLADAFGSAVVRTDAAAPGPDPEVASTTGPAPAALADVADLTSWVRTSAGLVATSGLTHAVLFVVEP